MLNFTHHIPTIVYFGKGQVSALEPELKKRAGKVLIVTGQGSVKKNGIFNHVIRQVKKADVPYVELSGIKPNPRLKSVYRGIEICKKESVDFILAVGGGSVIDASKAIASGVKYDGDVWDFFAGDVKPTDALPVGTVLTLAATGSEMNGNTVITKEDTMRKLAFGSPVIRPVFSILDPEYTYTVNKYHTAAGVVDIMVHVFEQYFSHTPASDVQDRIAEALLKVCVKYGPIVCEKLHDYDARANLLWTGSLALNDLIGQGKQEDWASHAIEHELSAIYDISHGAGLAIVSPNWMRYVLSRNTVHKFVEYGIKVWNIEKDRSEMDIANEAIHRTEKFFKSLGMPTTLKEVNISDEHFEKMAKSAIEDWGEIGSFKKLTEKDIVQILNASL
ncbi:MAG: iron-containing alcohol dehydrogenase [Candidatus Omnitrophota bacterium]|nr:MAG: iron-containing alcohol dehydrogenase [Candidatus Omnitrophota bacterium]